MFYELTPEFHEVPLADVSPERLTAGIISVQELEGVRERFGFAEAAVAECRFDKSEYRNTVDVYEDYSFGVVNIVDASDVFAPTDRVAFFFRRNLFLMV
ncbi:MAG: hypothetical protein PHY12_11645, partial [Eubacteriales bacterium]|nr:hypothetical protein [Eubacteriales bacterium]